MLAPGLIAGLFHLAQLRGEASAFRLGLSPLAIEMRLTFGELAGRRRQRDVVPLLRILQGGGGIGYRLLEGVARRALLLELLVELCLALRQPRDVGDGRLMLAPSLIAGLFHLAQLRGEASAFRLGLSPLAIEMRLTFGELAGRRRQRDVVPLLRIPQGGGGVSYRLLEGIARRALLLELLVELCLALRQPRDVDDDRLMLAPSVIAGLLDLAQLRDEAGAFRIGMGLFAIELRLTCGELAGRRRQHDAVPLLRIVQGGVGEGELGRERRFALDQSGNVGSGRFGFAASFNERSTCGSNFCFERSARGAFPSDLLLQSRLGGREGVEVCDLRLQLLPSCTQRCLQLARLGGRGCGMALLRGRTRVERCFSVREPALENAPRGGRRVKLRRQFGFALRKPFGVRDCRGMTQSDPFDFDCGFAELFVNHVPHRALELTLPCLSDRTCDDGGQVSQQ